MGSTDDANLHNARLEKLLARQDIRGCLLRFSRGIDRFDRELFLSSFHTDATISAGDFVGGPRCTTGSMRCTNRGRWLPSTTCSITPARSTVTWRTARPTTCSLAATVMRTELLRVDRMISRTCVRWLTAGESEFPARPRISSGSASIQCVRRPGLCRIRGDRNLNQSLSGGARYHRDQRCARPRRLHRRPPVSCA